MQQPDQEITMVHVDSSEQRNPERFTLKAAIF
jgi:hypothetical protein